jgi:hypothetical protein
LRRRSAGQAYQIVARGDFEEHLAALDEPS